MSSRDRGNTRGWAPHLTPLYQIEETETETGTETGAAEEGGPASKSL